MYEQWLANDPLFRRLLEKGHKWEAWASWAIRCEGFDVIEGEKRTREDVSEAAEYKDEIDLLCNGKIVDVKMCSTPFRDLYSRWDRMIVCPQNRHRECRLNGSSPWAYLFVQCVDRIGRHLIEVDPIELDDRPILVIFSETFDHWIPEDRWDSVRECYRHVYSAPWRCWSSWRTFCRRLTELNGD